MTRGDAHFGIASFFVFSASFFSCSSFQSSNSRFASSVLKNGIISGTRHLAISFIKSSGILHSPRLSHSKFSHEQRIPFRYPFFYSMATCGRTCSATQRKVRGAGVRIRREDSVELARNHRAYLRWMRNSLRGLYQNQVDDTKTVKSTDIIEIIKETRFHNNRFLPFSLHEKTIARICSIAGIGI